MIYKDVHTSSIWVARDRLDNGSRSRKECVEFGISSDPVPVVL
jgi:hypothetical protein